MNLDKERKRLSQAETLKDLQWDLESTSMIPVFQRPNPGSQDLYLSNALIPADKLKSPLSDNDLDLDLDLIGLPIVKSDEDGTRYSRMGAARLDERVKPLIIKRAFDRRKENSLEICEEFRLFNNLYRDEETNKYLKDNLVDGGYEEVVVAVVEPNCVKMLGKEIRQFLKHKEMYLLVRLTCHVYSEYSLEELGICQNEVKSDEAELPDGYLSWECTYRETREEGYQTESVLSATRLIGFSKIGEEKPVEFIADVDENGNEITLTCNEGLEAWIHFRKRVLDKYYREPHRYTVEDTFLVRHGSNGETEWILLMDDDHDDKVCVKLSMLALIPYEEQKHWGEDDIPPEGNISKTYLKRYGDGLIQFGGPEPKVSSTRPEHLFRQRYNELQAVCDTYLGWQLVRPFGTTEVIQYNVSGIPPTIRYSDLDEYNLRCLRVPFSANQGDFDWLILSITKILVDSLNQERLKELISDQEQAKLDQKKDNPKQSDPKGIDYLEAALSSFKVENAKCHIKFLRRLQGIRSTGSAHRKGKSYQKSVKYFQLQQLGLLQGFAEILRRAIEVLEFFIYIVQRGDLSGKKEVPVLYDLSEHLGELSKTLFPAEAEGISTDETWMRETVQWSRHIAGFLLTKVVRQFDWTPSELMNFCEQSITSLNPDATPADVRSAITDIAKVFIQEAPSSLQFATRILSRAEGTSMPTTEVFEKTASRVTYSKKLVDFSLGFVNHDEVADSAWYPQYVAHLLFYASCYTAYTYTHVLRAEELDSEPMISELVSIVRRAADVAERIAGDDARSQLQTVRNAAEHLAQAIGQQ